MLGLLMIIHSNGPFPHYKLFAKEDIIPTFINKTCDTLHIDNE